VVPLEMEAHLYFKHSEGLRRRTARSKLYLDCIVKICIKTFEGNHSSFDKCTYKSIDDLIYMYLFIYMYVYIYLCINKYRKNRLMVLSEKMKKNVRK
jgi:hypothetical protein